MGAAHGVGLGAAERLGRGQVRFEGFARAGVADGEHGRQLGGLDQAGGDARLRGEGDRGDVAARDGDAAGRGQLAALGGGGGLLGVEELGHAVGPRTGVRRAVEARPGVGVGQAVVGPAVDQDGRRTAPVARGHGVPDGRGDGARGPVRQGEDDDVVPDEVVDVRGLHEPVRQRHEVGVVPAEPVPRRGVRRDGTDLDVRVSREKAEDLTAGVPGCAGDCCCPRHAKTIRRNA